MEADARGFRVALVADEYVNPEPGALDALAVLEPAGWGVMQLPPAAYPEAVAEPLLEQIAEQAEEFVRHGYDVVLVGSRAGLEQALGRMGLGLPDRLVPSSADELASFVAARPAPAAAGG